MPRRTTRDDKIARTIRSALARLEAGDPRDEALKRRASRGTLKVNVATVCAEAGIGRHLLDGANGPYADELGMVAAASGRRGTGESLRSMLDKARADKRDAEEKLAQSQAYGLHLLTRQARLKQDVLLLEEEVRRLRGAGGEDEDLLDRMERFPPRLRAPRRASGRTDQS